MPSSPSGTAAAERAGADIGNHREESVCKEERGESPETSGSPCAIRKDHTNESFSGNPLRKRLVQSLPPRAPPRAFRTHALTQACAYQAEGPLSRALRRVVSIHRLRRAPLPPGGSDCGGLCGRKFDILVKKARLQQQQQQQKQGRASLQREGFRLTDRV